MTPRRTALGSTWGRIDPTPIRSASRRTPLLAAALAAACAVAAAQPVPASPACPSPDELRPSQLHGIWRAEFQGQWQGATLLFEPHPEYPASFRGTINRDGERSQVAGDLERGEFTLEESRDGRRISATWLGDVVAESCGREIRGTWQAEGAPAAKGFVLRKQQ